MNTKATHTNDTTEDKSSLGTSMVNCCSGKNRWFGSFIRIIILLLIVVIAFGLGVKLGMYKDMYRNMGNYGNMTNDHFRNEEMNRGGQNMRGNMQAHPMRASETQMNVTHDSVVSPDTATGTSAAEVETNE